jgi:hypothetical protein
MSEIVERLRATYLTASFNSLNGCQDCGIAANDASQAADEITRLTAEVERLRATLRAAYEVYAGSDGFIPETAAEGYQQQIIRQMVDCISAALTQPAPERTA